MLMALIGVLYGMQVGNLMNVANELSGEEAMALTLGIELLFEGLGCFMGPPLISTCHYITRYITL